MDTETAPVGLRERKKQETRQALSCSALRLVVQRGYANVLVEDIAAEAGVSPRTFNNYFSSKAEAIVSRHLDRALATAAALRSRPSDEPLWDAIAHATLDQVGRAAREPDRDWLAGVRLMIAEPALQGEFLKASAVSERELAAAVAERTCTHPDRELYPHLVAVAVEGARRVVFLRWMNADPPVPLAPMLRDALGQLAAGLPAPTERWGKS